MAVNALSAAKLLCEESNWQLTNLALQKILYIAHMVYMGRHDGARLVEQPFEAWDYGPVNPTLYQRAKMFGNKPVRNVFNSVPDMDPTTEEAEILRQTYQSLCNIKPASLVSITHSSKGAWAKTYTGSTTKLPLKDHDITAEYHARFQ